MKQTSKLKDLTNKVFGRLTVLNSVFNEKHGHRVWKCLCECGKITEVPSSPLIKGLTTSCGCYSKEVRNQCSKTHGDTHSILYNRWSSMHSRCKSNTRTSKWYSDRGINVWKRWDYYINFKEDMEASFLVHLKQHGARNTTLDRIDTNKGYSKENCKWSTNKEQHCNKRSGLNIKDYKTLLMFIDELNAAKGLSISLTKEEFITLSYNCRMKRLNNKQTQNTFCG